MRRIMEIEQTVRIDRMQHGSDGFHARVVYRVRRQPGVLVRIEFGIKVLVLTRRLRPPIPFRTLYVLQRRVRLQLHAVMQAIPENAGDQRLIPLRRLAVNDTGECQYLRPRNSFLLCFGCVWREDIREAAAKPGSRLNLRVIRGGQTAEVAIVAIRRPDGT